MSAVAVFITAANAREARRLAETLVAEKLAACVTDAGVVRSVYRWKGRVERARERLLIAKTARRRLAALTARVKTLHSYEVPETVAFPLVGGNAAYLAWVERETDQRAAIPSEHRGVFKAAERATTSSRTRRPSPSSKNRG
ncbi:MAG: divalent-cation tolerance protein CutA [Elusimicrobia bacterium]|nr:divalent-cation tolerance protein CutA [Elusimicrobiota bacterium]MBK7207175.1 divalent-cation tolerance protein CutA [Elusimicrobiota bacterium]MBK7545981.1 divalent-cation tolerance protein CutA [Elusimicrobiota bacterium]MBK7574857.1 divalent-cation tolerance protein CutA [Elusimicrobiota bacterium]MBK7687493.1 divalent-cation tolerance protein CutA [Elusimicrobiota bacterium]